MLTLPRLAAELRSIPARNPAHASDGYLILADAIAEAARFADQHGDSHAAAGLRDIEAAARDLAPIFAPAPLSADAATHILRRED